MPLGTSLNNQPAVFDPGYMPSGTALVRKNITFAQQAGNAEIPLGVLPANASIIPTSSGVWIKTAFDGTGTTIDVGVAGTPALFGSALATGSAVFVPLDDAALATAAPSNAARNLVARINGTVATVGSADVILGVAAG